MANANCFRVDIINTVLINVLSTKDRSAIVSLGWVRKLKVSFYCLPLSMTNSCCWDLNVDGLTGAMLARPNAMMVEVWWRFWSWGLFKILLRLKFGDLVEILKLSRFSGCSLVEILTINSDQLVIRLWKSSYFGESTSPLDPLCLCCAFSDG